MSGVDQGSKEVEAVLEEFQGWGITKGPSFSRKLSEALPKVVEPDEEPVALVGGLHKSRRVALLLTSKRVLLLHPSGPASNQVWSHQEVDAQFEGLWLASTLRLKHHGGEVELTNPQPAPEVHRIVALLTAGDLERSRLGDAFRESDPLDPNALPVAYFDGIAAYHDRLIDEKGQHYPYRGPVDVRVDELGNITATRGRNLGEKFGGFLVLGPIGPFLTGNAKVTKEDNRELYLLIESDDWAFSRKCEPKQSEAAFRFATALRNASKSSSVASSEGEGGTPLSVAQEIRELGQLRDEGLLTEEEFAQQKAKLLSR